MTIAEYTSILRRRRWIVVIAILVALGAFLGNELTKPDRYQASADVLLNDQTAASLVGLAQPVSSEAADRFAETQKALARVPELARRTLRALNLTDRTPKELLDNSNVRTKPNQDILEFSVTDGDRAQAIALATEYARRFPVYRRELDTSAIVKAQQEVQAQLIRARLRGGTTSPLYASLSEQLSQLRTLGALQTTSAQLVRPAEDAKQVQPRPVRAGSASGSCWASSAVLPWRSSATRRTRGCGLRSRSPKRFSCRCWRGFRRRRRARRAPSRSRSRGAWKPRHSEYFGPISSWSTSSAARRRSWSRAGRRARARRRRPPILPWHSRRLGKSVIAVDLDLRRPGLGRLFEAANEPGITDIVLSRADIVGAMHVVMNGVIPMPGSSAASRGTQSRVPKGSLYYIGTGIVPPNPGEFIATHAVSDLLNSLKKRADVVIVDSPPLLSVGDGIALMSQLDAVLIVSRLTKTRRPGDRRAEARARQLAGRRARRRRHRCSCIRRIRELPVVRVGAEARAAEPEPTPEPARLSNE